MTGNLNAVNLKDFPQLWYTLAYFSENKNANSLFSYFLLSYNYLPISSNARVVVVNRSSLTLNSMAAHFSFLRFQEETKKNIVQ